MGAAITEAAGIHGITVAHEADATDIVRQVGWSVVVVGTARVILDHKIAEAYRAMVEPWVAGPAPRTGDLTELA